ncbi:hypothetical protein SNEBB_007030 [Seison nebaliae]|nr:hypothetical protein SNEBB_007030 [Seison nebaliae]
MNGKSTSIITTPSSTIHYNHNNSNNNNNNYNISTKKNSINQLTNYHRNKNYLQHQQTLPSNFAPYSNNNNNNNNINRRLNGRKKSYMVNGRKPINMISTRTYDNYSNYRNGNNYRSDRNDLHNINSGESNDSGFSQRYSSMKHRRIPTRNNNNNNNMGMRNRIPQYNQHQKMTSGNGSSIRPIDENNEKNTIFSSSSSVSSLLRFSPGIQLSNDKKYGKKTDIDFNSFIFKEFSPLNDEIRDRLYNFDWERDVDFNENYSSSSSTRLSAQSFDVIEEHLTNMFQKNIIKCVSDSPSSSSSLVTPSTSTSSSSFFQISRLPETSTTTFTSPLENVEKLETESNNMNEKNLQFGNYIHSISNDQTKSLQNHQQIHENSSNYHNEQLQRLSISTQNETNISKLDSSELINDNNRLLTIQLSSEETSTTTTTTMTTTIDLKRGNENDFQENHSNLTDKVKNNSNDDENEFPVKKPENDDDDDEDEFQDVSMDLLPVPNCSTSLQLENDESKDDVEKKLSSDDWNGFGESRTSCHESIILLSSRDDDHLIDGGKKMNPFHMLPKDNYSPTSLSSSPMALSPSFHSTSLPDSEERFFSVSDHFSPETDEVLRRPNKSDKEYFDVSFREVITSNSIDQNEIRNHLNLSNSMSISISSSPSTHITTAILDNAIIVSSSSPTSSTTLTNCKMLDHASFSWITDDDIVINIDNKIANKHTNISNISFSSGAGGDDDDNNIYDPTHHNITSITSDYSKQYKEFSPLSPHSTTNDTTTTTPPPSHPLPPSHLSHLSSNRIPPVSSSSSFVMSTHINRNVLPTNQFLSSSPIIATANMVEGDVCANNKNIMNIHHPGNRQNIIHNEPDSNYDDDDDEDDEVFELQTAFVK